MLIDLNSYEMDDRSTYNKFWTIKAASKAAFVLGLIFMILSKTGFG